MNSKQYSSSNNKEIINGDYITQDLSQPPFGVMIRVIQSLSQVLSEKEVLMILLEEVCLLTQALGASYLPFRDNGESEYFLSNGNDASSQVIEDWKKYLDALAIRRQCKICQSEEPFADICPLLSNPFTEPVKLFCIRLTRGTNNLGVINIYLLKNVILKDDLKDIVGSIADLSAISLEESRLRKTSPFHLQSRDDMDNRYTDQYFDENIQQKLIIEERARLAREIHDGLAQILGYVKLELSQMEGYLESSSHEKLVKSIRLCHQAVADAYIDAREAIDDLFSSTEGSDLAKWLMKTASEFESNFAIQIEIIDFPDDLVLSPNENIHLIRIIQESLSNIRKHASANSVRITFSKENERNRIEIHDDGVGFEPSKLSKQSQHGIRIMKERADMIMGVLTVNSDPKHGTSVTIWY